jgi:hypothetical protein
MLRPCAVNLRSEGVVASKANLSAPLLEESSFVIERRTDSRYPILQQCFVWPLGSPKVEPWRCIVYNVSRNGLGIALPFAPRLGTVFQVEAWGIPGARSLDCRVLRTSPVEFLWFCGCELTSPLLPEELRVWLSRNHRNRVGIGGGPNGPQPLDLIVPGLQ